MGQGRALLEQGRVEEGLARLDEAMVAVTADELTPPVTGLIYCGLIAGCREVFDVRRAHEWTAALSSWWAEQPDLFVYTGECLVHRAEVMQHQGAWRDALEEAERASKRFAARLGSSRSAAGQAAYRQGELQRLLGESAAAEDAYREASGLGWEPQPGLALLRLAQGDARGCRGCDPPSRRGDDPAAQAGGLAARGRRRSCSRSASSRRPAAPPASSRQALRLPAPSCWARSPRSHAVPSRSPTVMHRRR